MSPILGNINGPLEGPHLGGQYRRWPPPVKAVVPEAPDEVEVEVTEPEEEEPGDVTQLEDDLPDEDDENNGADV